jgi:hypothetical protein
MLRTKALLAFCAAASLASIPVAEDCDANGLDDAHEMSAKPFLDTNFNGTLDLCEGLSVDTDQISLASGGAQTLHVELGPAFAGYLYWMLGSTAGESTGTPFGGVTVPLTWDGFSGYMSYTIKHANSGVLSSGVGFLDQSGSADARFELAPGSDPALAGVTVRHAYAIFPFGANAFFWSSNSVSVKLVP